MLGFHLISNGIFIKCSSLLPPPYSSDLILMFCQRHWSEWVQATYHAVLCVSGQVRSHPDDVAASHSLYKLQVLLHRLKKVSNMAILLPFSNFNLR